MALEGDTREDRPWGETTNVLKTFSENQEHLKIDWIVDQDHPLHLQSLGQEHKFKSFII